MSDPFASCLRKQGEIIALFAPCSTPAERYETIIELGRALPPMPDALKTEEAIVPGCQSIVYLHSTYQSGLLSFQASSEALISAGLAALLIRAYNGETPEAVLKCKPLFLETLEIATSLSPNRASGLSNMLLRMQRDAMKSLLPL